MRRVIGVSVMVLLLMGAAYGATTITKKAGDYTVGVTLDRNPPIVGKNHVDVSVKDSMGMVITDAKVVVEYSMPAMPGMPAAHYKTDAELKGDTYKGIIEPSMSGPWNMAVKVIRGNKTGIAKLTLDVK